MLVEVLGLALLFVLLAVVVAIAVRRRVLSRSGGVDVCWRRRLTTDGRGWSFGQGQYRGGELVLYRSFSPLPISSRVLRRDRLLLGSRRNPVGTEPDLLPLGSVILRCTDAGNPLELAMSDEAATGLRSWLESVPPETGHLHGRPHRGTREVSFRRPASVRFGRHPEPTEHLRRD